MKAGVIMKKVGAKKVPFKEVVFSPEDIEIELEAYEYEADEFAFDEPRGDVISKYYKPSEITKALKNFLDAHEKGYEVVSLRIRSKKGGEGYFTIDIRPNRVVVRIGASMEGEAKLEECLERLKKIQELARM
ncbi:hypothetical protein [Pyrococcus kukulkanii]|uniref:Uncharacterized protein n=1 Tax=Pyrococcus kukulkanii TaxID=1609559 RepID=A0ABV4T9F9_9EURY